jgi:hypothetical protein
VLAILRSAVTELGQDEWETIIFSHITENLFISGYEHFCVAEEGISWRILLCEISGSHGSEYEDESLLGYGTVSLGVDQRFRGAFCLQQQGDE